MRALSSGVPKVKCPGAGYKRSDRNPYSPGRPPARVTDEISWLTFPIFVSRNLSAPCAELGRNFTVYLASLLSSHYPYLNP